MAKRRFIIKVTSNETYAVCDLTGSVSKRVTIDRVRYETFDLKRAKRILELFQHGLI